MSQLTISLAPEDREILRALIRPAPAGGRPDVKPWSIFEPKSKGTLECWVDDRGQEHWRDPSAEESCRRIGWRRLYVEVL